MIEIRYWVVTFHLFPLSIALDVDANGSKSTFYATASFLL